MDKIYVNKKAESHRTHRREESVLPVTIFKVITILLFIGTWIAIYFVWRMAKLNMEPKAAMENTSNAVQQHIQEAIEKGYMKDDDGWVMLFNGYTYKEIPEKHFRNDSRAICQQMGGDLAQYGIRDIGNRLKLRKALSLDQLFYWVGARFSLEEEKWRWPNGDLAFTTDRSLWFFNPGGGWDCSVIIYAQYTPNFEKSFIFDQHCKERFPAVCEKHF